MSLFAVALSMLTSLTGVATTNKIDTTVVDLSNVCSSVGETYSILTTDVDTGITIDINNSQSSILNYEEYEKIDLEEIDLKYFYSEDLLYFNDVYDLRGLNRYVEVVFNDKYVLYDKYEFTIVETSYKDNNPYKNYKDDFKVYTPGQYGFKYLVFNVKMNTFLNAITFEEVDFDEVYDYYQASDIGAGYYVHYGSYSNPSTIAITHDFYFENLFGGYGYNSTGVCGIVSSQVLLQYMNFFYNDNITDDMYEYTASAHSNRLTDYLISPSTGESDFNIPDNDYLNILINACTRITGVSPIGGMTADQHIEFLLGWFDELDINVYANYCTGNLSDVLTDYTQTIMRNAINADRPVIANGCEHSFVAFAYCDDYVYVETGFNSSAMKTSWDTFDSKMFGFRSTAIDIVYNDVHVCSNDYFNASTHQYMCPCEMII